MLIFSLIWKVVPDRRAPPKQTLESGARPTGHHQNRLWKVVPDPSGTKNSIWKVVPDPSGTKNRVWKVVPGHHQNRLSKVVPDPPGTTKTDSGKWCPTRWAPPKQTLESGAQNQIFSCKIIFFSCGASRRTKSDGELSWGALKT